jgi:hypothetical protein
MADFRASVEDAGSTVEAATSAAVGVAELEAGVSVASVFVSVPELQAFRNRNNNAITENFFMFEEF